MEILEDSLTTLVPRNHVTSGFGFALHLHFIVIKVPVSFGMIRGFSTNVGAKPGPSSASWKDPRLSTIANRVGFQPSTGRSDSRSRIASFVKIHWTKITIEPVREDLIYFVLMKLDDVKLIFLIYVRPVNSRAFAWEFGSGFASWKATRKGLCD